MPDIADLIIRTLSDFVDWIINHSMDRLIFGTGGLLALIYFGRLFVWLCWESKLLQVAYKHLFGRLEGDPPEFNPKSPNAASLTAITGILGAILSPRLLPNPATIHLPTADTYTYLNAFFVALLGLALLFYYSVGRRLVVYLIADYLIFWGVCGVVFSFDLALLELTKFSPWSRVIFAVIVSLALVVGVISRIGSTLEQLWLFLTPIQAEVDKAKEVKAPGLVVAIPPVLRLRWQVK